MTRLLLVLTLLLNSPLLQAQKTLMLTGTLNDTSGQKVIGAAIQLISAKDTIYTTSNENGYFAFNNIPQQTFTLKVKTLTYELWEKSYNYNTTENKIQLPPIILRYKSNMLHEIVIKSKIPKVLFKNDTIEYSVNQYKLRENSVVEDLLKRLPGLKVDDKGNITFMGKPINKIRINGRDVKIDNIQTLTQFIPTELLEKIQLIDDYGDLARITRNKTGVPEKIINIQTVSNLNNAQDLKSYAGIGTSKTYSIGATGLVIDKKDNLFTNINSNNNSPGLGTTNRKNGTISYHYESGLNKYNISLQVDRPKTLQDNNASYSTITSEGEIKGVSSSTNNNKLSNNNLEVGFEHKYGPNDILILNLKSSLNSQESQTNLNSTQTGIQILNQTLNNLTSNKTQLINGSILGINHLGKSNNLISYGLTIEYNDNPINNNIADHTSYFNADSILVKDSSLTQMIKNSNKNYKVLLQGSFTKNIDSNSNIELSFSGNLNNKTTNINTQWLNNDGKFQIVDSLSDSYDYKISQYNSNINYKYNLEKLTLTVGGTLSNFIYNGIKGNIVMPNLRLSYKINNLSFLGVSFNKSISFPSFQQVRKIPDISNPLYPIIGNPVLKPTTNDVLSLDYRYGGRNTVFMSLSGNINRNAIVSNTVLTTDNFNSVIQETHFINTNGLYTLNASYGWSRQFADGKRAIYFDGGSSYNTNLFYTGNILNKGNTISITQTINASNNLSWWEFSPIISYTYTANRYENNPTMNTILQSWQFQFSNRFFIGKSWTIWIAGNKQLNMGYAKSITANPLILVSTIEKSFFEKKLNLKLQGFNLLDETRNISREITGNTITETRANRLGRYFMLSIELNLKKFTKN